jgi:hypothetical protein
LSLRRFLDIAEYMLVEDAQRIPGVTLLSAIDLVAPSQKDAPKALSERQVAAQNESSLKQLEQMMKGVK